MLDKETKNVTSAVVCDPRLGAMGTGIYLLPIGVAACLLAFFGTLRAVFDPELISFASANLIAIWILAVIAAGFFLMLALGGCTILLQARYVVQRLEGYESITIRPFLGGEIRTVSAEVVAVEPVSPHRPWIPMTLLSREIRNWKISVHGRREYFVNGEIPDAEQWFRKFQACRSGPQSASHFP